MTAISADTIGHFPSLRESGLFHRRMTEGDEKQMVDAFIARHLTPAPAGQVRFVFVEPRLETGFPDLVVVYLDRAAAREWNFERADLGKREICVLHHLATSRTQEFDRLKFLFPDGLRRTLKKLETARLVRNTKTGWKAESAKRLMAVRRIVAVEAKVGNWRPGLDQAFMNRWFASESYLLLPGVPKSAELHVELQASGVGLLTADTPLRRPYVAAAKGKLPGSYASWLFNEWACHARAATKAKPTSAAKSRRGLPPANSPQHA